MRFADPKEQAANLGPLFAAEAKAEVPVFGPDRYTSPHTKAALAAKVTKALKSTDDLVVDSLVPKETEPEDAASLSESISKLRLKANKLVEVEKSQLLDSTILTPKKVYSSRELHDKSHYGVVSLFPWANAQREVLDHVVLSRAKAGYLFDCKKNKSLVGDDKWLQDVWDWILGAELAAKDDGMVALSLDLSYLGVYTIWMNLLGMSFILLCSLTILTRHRRKSRVSID